MKFRFFNFTRKTLPQREQDVIALLHTKFQIQFKDLSLYLSSLRHKSAARNIHNKPELSNERLEFLGDAVLDAAVAHYLFSKYPGAEEGDLTKMKSRIVSRMNLNHLAKVLGIDHLLETDLQATHARESIAGNALEAMFGAMYLDLGYPKTFDSILRILEKHTNLESVPYMEADFKSRLYEEAHKRRQHLHFDTRNLSDKDAEKVFQSDVFLDRIKLGTGKGSSKKKAEQMAAKLALHKLNLEEA